MNTFTGINQILFYDFYANIIDFTCKSGLICSYSIAILLYIESISCSLFGRFANYLTVVSGRYRSFFCTVFIPKENAFYYVSNFKSCQAIRKS